MQFSSCLNISVPKSWEEMSDAQLRYVYLLQSQGRPMVEVRNMFFLRLTGLVPQGSADDGSWLMAAPRQLYKVSFAQLGIAVSHLKWMDEPSSVPVRPSAMGEHAAIDAYLHGIPFGDYLTLDNYYQGFLTAHDDEDMLGMAQILYPGTESLPELPDQVGILAWVVSLKLFFSAKWSDLFSPAGEGGTSDQESVMNAMIRALTGGDVLKERLILEEVDTWRALTELNEKAKEAKELKSMKS